MPRSLAENKWKKIHQSLQLLFEAQRQHQQCYETKVQNILTEFGLNPLKFPRKDGKEERKILLEWKTHINKPLNRVEKLGKCEEKERWRSFLFSFRPTDLFVYFCAECAKFGGFYTFVTSLNGHLNIFRLRFFENNVKDGNLVFANLCRFIKVT